MISATKEILARCEAKAGEIVREKLIQQGVDFHLEARATQVRSITENAVEILLDNGRLVTGSKILIATGRVPNTARLGVKESCLSTKDNSVVVDDSMRAVNEQDGWLYAIGDVNGRSPFTHMGAYQARIAARNILANIKGETHNGFQAFGERFNAPQIIFTNPTVAQVGMTWEQAQETGQKVRKIENNLEFPGAWLHGNKSGDWVQWVVEEESHKLLGATLVGREIGDLLHASTIAIVSGIDVRLLSHAVPAFPTRSEVYNVFLDLEL